MKFRMKRLVGRWWDLDEEDDEIWVMNFGTHHSFHAKSITTLSPPYHPLHPKFRHSPYHLLHPKLLPPSSFGIYHHFTTPFIQILSPTLSLFPSPLSGFPWSPWSYSLDCVTYLVTLPYHLFGWSPTKLLSSRSYYFLLGIHHLLCHLLQLLRPSASNRIRFGWRRWRNEW